MARSALLLLGVLVPALAHAQEPTRGQQAAARYAEGAARYAAKDFTGAAASFREAYAIVNDPAFLFDIAQAYRLADDCGNAAPFYRAFLAAAPARARHRAAAMAALRVCVAPEPVEGVPESEVAVEEEVIVHDDGSPAQRTVGLVTAGGGVLAAGLAAFFAIRAHRTSSDIEDELVDNGGMWTDEVQERHDEAQRDDAAAIGLSIGSALAMVTGSVLWYLGRAKGAEVIVTPQSGGATVGWTGRF